jgi:signal transduction histidine kinase
MPSRRLAAVAQLTDALGRATTPEDVYTAALDAIQASLTDRASVLLFDENGVMSFVAWRGISDDYRRAVHGHTPWTPQTQAPKPISVSDVFADESLARYHAVFEQEKIRALGFLPLTYRGQVIGKFMLYYGEPHEFTEDELQFASTIGGQIAFGVARARAEEELQRERDRLAQELEKQREAEKRAEFLNEASQLLASSLDYETTLDHVAQLIVERLAHWCTIDLIETDGRVRRLAVRHREIINSEALKRVAESPGTYRSIVPTVIETGTAVLSEDATAAIRSIRQQNPPLAAAIEELGIASFMSVPLRAGGRTIGALGIVSSDPAKRFDGADLELATELGRRAAYAIDNARLFREAQAANRAKDEFLATLSHELRTPMTATLGWASMLKIGEMSADTFRTAVETIDRSTRAQAKLIDDILDVSRIVTGKLQLSFSPVSLANVTEAAIQTIRPTALAKTLQIQLRIDAPDAIVMGDSGRLQQVIWNLLSNAVKFTSPGGIVAVSVEKQSSNFVRVSVADSGCGIASRFLPHIFERFRQGDSSSTRTHGGLGLGLAIVKSLVELHAGSVTAESDGQGQGSRFTVTLPMRPASDIGLAPLEATPPLSLAGVDILLVEDQADTRSMLHSALTHFGARVTAVASVDAAFEVMMKTPPAVVVSDIGMPGEDGYGLIGRMRSGEKLRSIPAIALTAFARPEDRQRALESGFTHHLAKPIDPMVVVKTVRDVLMSSRA